MWSNFSKGLLTNVFLSVSRGWPSLSEPSLPLVLFLVIATMLVGSLSLNIFCCVSRWGSGNNLLLQIQLKWIHFLYFDGGCIVLTTTGKETCQRNLPRCVAHMPVHLKRQNHVQFTALDFRKPNRKLKKYVSSLSNFRQSLRHMEDNPIYGNLTYTQTSKRFVHVQLS